MHDVVAETSRRGDGFVQANWIGEGEFSVTLKRGKPKLLHRQNESEGTKIVYSAFLGYHKAIVGWERGQ